VIASCEQIGQARARNNSVFGKAPAGSDGGAAGAGEIVTIGAGDAFNDAKLRRRRKKHTASSDKARKAQ